MKATDKLQAAEAGMQLHVNVVYWSTVYCSHVPADMVTCSAEFVLYQKFWTSKVQLQTMAPAYSVFMWNTALGLVVIDTRNAEE